MTQLIVALDVPRSDAIPLIIESLPSTVELYKIGLEIFCAEGPHALEPLKTRGKRIFLDLKLHDIPRTVERAVQSLLTLNIDMFTVHASGGQEMLKAVANTATNGPVSLAVTALTSLGSRDLTDLGITRSPQDHVLKLAEMALKCGIRGLVCSAHEVAALRLEFGPDPVLVVPGIRPSGAAHGDQKRVATPADAAKAGASYIVVGRPILEASDPRAAAENVLREIGQ